MKLLPIHFENLLIHPFSQWENDWLLLTSGDFNSYRFNCMTVGWGSIGIMWGRPFVQVVVRPQRHTYTFTEQYPTFTVCAFSKKYRSVLNVLGTKSGRDIDKITDSGLTPQASEMIDAPGYLEAELIFECVKIYWDDLEPANFIDLDIQRNYPKKDYHRIYYGEIVMIRGTEKYLDRSRDISTDLTV